MANASTPGPVYVAPGHENYSSFGEGSSAASSAASASAAADGAVYSVIDNLKFEDSPTAEQMAPDIDMMTRVMQELLNKIPVEDEDGYRRFRAFKNIYDLSTAVRFTIDPTTTDPLLLAEIDNREKLDTLMNGMNEFFLEKKRSEPAPPPLSAEDAANIDQMKRNTEKIINTVFDNVESTIASSAMDILALSIPRDELERGAAAVRRGAGGGYRRQQRGGGVGDG
jgi:hypothetical protein